MITTANTKAEDFPLLRESKEGDMVLMFVSENEAIALTHGVHAYCLKITGGWVSCHNKSSWKDKSEFTLRNK